MEKYHAWKVNFYAPTFSTSAKLATGSVPIIAVVKATAAAMEDVFALMESQVTIALDLKIAFLLERSV